MDLYWGLNLDEWKTLSIVAQGALMIFLVATGVYQLLAIRAQAKRTATLEMCTRYASDATLSQCKQFLYKARITGDMEKHPHEYRHSILTCLNYLDMVAIGVQRGIYDEKLTRDYLKWVVQTNVQRYLKKDLAKRFDISLPAYENLIELDRKWGDPSHTLSEEEKKQRHEIIVYGKTSTTQP